MWLPSSIYERVPQFYVLAGLLLIADGFYIGSEMTYSYAIFYYLLGCCSLVRGIQIFVLRYIHRNSDKAVAPQDQSLAESGSAAERTQVLGSDEIPTAQSGH